MKNNICILRWIVKNGTLKSLHASMPGGSSVIDPNIISTVLIHNLKNAWPI